MAGGIALIEGENSENLNSRVRKCIRNHLEISHGYLDLLRLFLNPPHTTKYQNGTKRENAYRNIIGETPPTFA